MGITIKTSLNEIFEILGLLYINSHPEVIEKGQIVEAASEFGINGNELYEKFGNIQKRYVKEFQKELVKSEGDAFFFEDSNNSFVLILQIVLATNSHWIDGIDDVSEDEIYMAFIDAIEEGDKKVDKKPTLNETIEILKSAKLEPDMCWKLMLFLQEPKKYINHLAGTVKQNIPAYERAIISVEKPLKRLLDEFPKFPYKIPSILKRDIMEIVITPILIYPGIEVLDINGDAYVGLFTKDIYQMMDNQKISRNNLIPILKALSDSSKFDILVSLRNSPKYNMELAEQLGLTAATISHHMNTLLLHGFISVEKRDGRVYYTFVKDTIEDIIAKLQHTFDI